MIIFLKQTIHLFRSNGTFSSTRIFILSRKGFANPAHFLRRLVSTKQYSDTQFFGSNRSHHPKTHISPFCALDPQRVVRAAEHDNMRNEGTSTINENLAELSDSESRQDVMLAKPPCISPASLNLSWKQPRSKNKKIIANLSYGAVGRIFSISLP